MAGEAAASGGHARAALRAETAAVKDTPTRTTAGAALAGAWYIAHVLTSPARTCNTNECTRLSKSSV
eukprot:7215684-Pyramimonas_sp.AAC.1